MVAASYLEGNTAAPPHIPTRWIFQSLPKYTGNYEFHHPFYFILGLGRKRKVYVSSFHATPIAAILKLKEN